MKTLSASDIQTIRLIADAVDDSPHFDVDAMPEGHIAWWLIHHGYTVVEVGQTPLWMT